MSEASAKMHLRDYVRADDIDLAIQVTVGSFVNAQKMSIKKTLERGFRKYVHVSSDSDELLAFVLGQLVKEKAQIYYHQRGENPRKVTIRVAQLEARAKELDLYDVQPFLRSQVFKKNGYNLIPGDPPTIEKDFVFSVGE